MKGGNFGQVGASVEIAMRPGLQVLAGAVEVGVSIRKGPSRQGLGPVLARDEKAGERGLSLREAILIIE